MPVDIIEYQDYYVGDKMTVKCKEVQSKNVAKSFVIKPVEKKSPACKTRRGPRGLGKNEERP